MAVHLLDGLFSQVLGPEFQNSAAAGFLIFVAEQLYVGHVADLIAKKILKNDIW